MLQYIGYYGELPLLLRRLYYYRRAQSCRSNARHAQTANEFFRDFKKNWSNFLKWNFGTLALHT